MDLYNIISYSLFPPSTKMFILIQQLLKIVYNIVVQKLFLFLYNHIEYYNKASVFYLILPFTKI